MMIPCYVNCFPLLKLPVLLAVPSPFMVLFALMVLPLPVSLSVKLSFTLTVVCWALRASLTPCCKTGRPSYVTRLLRAMYAPLRLPVNVLIWSSVLIPLPCLLLLPVCITKSFRGSPDRCRGKGSY